MTSIYAMFDTDEHAEKEGVFVDYGNVRMLLARAGGSNPRFAKVLRAKMKPYRRQIDAETLPDSVADRIMAETYAEAVILRIDSMGPDGQWIERQIAQRDGTLKPHTPESTVALLLDLPELLRDLQSVAGGVSMYRRQLDEADRGN
jgi:hypothetical protein